ncbi:MAG: hypothetical protein C4329_10165, partial [Chitinophagaceae bacterium]
KDEQLSYIKWQRSIISHTSAYLRSPLSAPIFLQPTRKPKVKRISAAIGAKCGYRKLKIAKDYKINEDCR